MNNQRTEYNKKMIGQKVEVVENPLVWLGEVVETVDDHSFLIRDESNRDSVVSIFDVRSLEMAHLSHA
jgi:ATP-dependent 26S proteasome regulatory subunit